ncbi:uncharacterized protein LOC130385898 isoform X3 [Gadus chalcogrammus]|uniref:uncharacterized protein LOC130385898 isoform X3 n=1 Tax=Gadus chalcogrammus TaxID=1042646 RepID=UPI0024C3CA8D|nr:uncharacterized protein LOC130385898 isoform X3 [Gadus chalcogrammus]
MYHVNIKLTCIRVMPNDGDSVLTCVVYHFIALFYRWLKIKRDLTEYANRIDEMKTPGQVDECWALRKRLDKKKKTPKQKRKFDKLKYRYWTKRESLEVDWTLTEWEKLIDEMETPEQVLECLALWEQLEEKKKTPKQERKFDELNDRYWEKRESLEIDWTLTDGAAGEGTSGPSSTPLLSTELPAGLETSIPPAPSSETQPAGLETSIPPAPSSETQPAGLETSIPPAPSSETQPAGLETSIPPAPSSETQPAGLETSIPPAPSSETQPAGLETSIPPAPSSETQPAGLETSIPPAPSSETQPAGLETSIPPAPSSETQPAGLETSIPPAPSSETQPAEETTPLMSSESPAPTGDQQEHTSRTSTPDVTMDGHDDDQSLDALAYRSGTGQIDIEMGPVQTLPKERNRIL